MYASVIGFSSLIDYAKDILFYIKKISEERKEPIENISSMTELIKTLNEYTKQNRDLLIDLHNTIVKNKEGESL